MKYIGGYSILDLTDANVSAQANACYNQDKPVLVYGANGERYFADTITKSGTSIIITKGGKTITIANDNTITNVGDIQPLMENIVDIEGHNRFVEGDGEDLTIEGFTFTYKKWSLSGTHLMVVLAGEIANATTISAGTKIGDFILPEWILDKIYPIQPLYGDIEKKTLTLYAENLGTQTVVLTFIKGDNNLYINCNNITLTEKRYFRIQFDLLIDTE